MKVVGIAKHSLFWLAMIWSVLAIAAEVDDPQAIPALSARVTDTTATLTAEQKATLEQSLAAFEQKKGAQIAVLIVPSTEPETIEQYSMRVVEQWKLGRKNVDDGALLIIAKDDRTLRIEVGYGLEGALNDATSKRIISEVILPYFKQGDFFDGINAGISSMMNVINGEPLPAPRYGSGSRSEERSSYAPVIFIAILALGGILRAIFGRFFGSIAMGVVTALLAWALVGTFAIAIFAGVLAGLITLFSGGAHGLGRGYYGSGGSKGGGGFGGGGGGFGGGGASGRW